MYFLSWILMGSVVGWLIGRLLTGNGYGPVVDVVMGVSGAVAGGVLVRLITSPIHGLAYTIPAALFGAVLFTATMAYTNGRRRWA